MVELLLPPEPLLADGVVCPSPPPGPRPASSAPSCQVAILDAHGIIVEVSASWPRSGGWQGVPHAIPPGVGDAYLSAHLDPAAPPGEEAAALARGLRSVLAGESEEFTLEYPCPGAPGPRWLLVRANRLGGGPGPGRVVVSHVDLTARKRAEEELRWKSAFFAAQVNSSLDAMIVVDQDGKKILQNQLVNEFFKIPPHIVNDDDDQKQVQWVMTMTRDPERFVTQIRQLNAHPEAVSRDEIELKDGRTLDRYTAPVLGQEGDYYGRIWTFRDVTEQRSAEAALRMQAHMLNHVGRAVIATDMEGKITYANRFAAELYGWPATEMLGQNIMDVTVPVTSQGQGEQILQRLQRGDHMSGEFFVRSREGTEFPAVVTSTPLRDQHGAIIGIVGISEDITERRRAEEELHRNAQEQRQLADQLSAEKARLVAAQAVAKLGSWEVDEVAGLLTWSEETHRIFETDSARYAPTQESAMRFVHPDDRQKLADALQHSLAHRSACSLEHRLLLDNGRIKTVEERWQPILGEDGRIVRLLGTCQDITERRRTEEALREAEAKYRSIFENSTDGIFQNTPDGRMLSANPALARILGFASAEELIRERTDLGNQGYADPTQREAFQRQLEEQGFINDFEYEVRRRDGSTIWVCENTRVIRGLDGQALYYEGSVQDITARKRAEEELSRSRETLRGILDHIPQRVFWKDRNSVFLGCNHPFAADMGFREPDDLVGKTDYETNARTGAELYRADDRQVMEADVAMIGYEELGTAPDGRPVWLRTNKIPLHDWRGQVIGLLGTYEDITEHKLAKLEIERLNSDLERRVVQRTADLFAATREAERANAAKSEFLSRTSHELRTPLNAILGFGQLLEMEDDLGAQPRESVEQILTAGRHLLKLIDEVLDISNAESGGIPLALGSVAVVPLVEESLSLVRSLGISLRVNLEPVLPMEDGGSVRADPQRLRQVLLNLLSNAIKYNRPGGTVAVTFAHAPAASPPRSQIRVNDTGPGISAEHQTRLFTPFDRLDAERTKTHVAGTGLGLALAKRMVELMGGTLGVESVVGQGSTFWVELPTADAESGPED